jgi:hypothetical protein
MNDCEFKILNDYIVHDQRTLNALGKRYGFIYDKVHDYVLYYNETRMEMNGRKFKIKYFDGCIYPYVVEI